MEPDFADDWAVINEPGEKFDDDIEVHLHSSGLKLCYGRVRHDKGSVDGKFWNIIVLGPKTEDGNDISLHHEILPEDAGEDYVLKSVNRAVKKVEGFLGPMIRNRYIE